jgi:hypothetical protein
MMPDLTERAQSYTEVGFVPETSKKLLHLLSHLESPGEDDIMALINAALQVLSVGVCDSTGGDPVRIERWEQEKNEVNHQALEALQKGRRPITEEQDDVILFRYVGGLLQAAGSLITYSVIRGQIREER